MGTEGTVAIITDSVASLSTDFLDLYRILLVPQQLIFQGQVYRDGIDIDPDTFYGLLTSTESVPTTSTPSPASFLDAFRKGAQQAKSILCITVASQLSGTYSSAETARGLFHREQPDIEVTLMDSATATGAQGLIVLAAARSANTGAFLKEVCSVAEFVRKRVRLLAFMDTLYYAWRGGRVPRIATWFGSLLQIKPLLELSQGQVSLYGRPRTRQRATDYLIKSVSGNIKNSPIRVNIVHAKEPLEARALQERMQTTLPCDEVLISEFSPVMGAHTGPGVLGLAYYPINAED